MLCTNNAITKIDGIFPHSTSLELTCNSRKIQHTRNCNPSWCCIVSKNYQLIFGSTVAKEMNTFLNIRDNYSITKGLYSDYNVGNMLK